MNPHAQSLGSLGGKARARNLSKEELSAISKKGNDAKRAKKLLIALSQESQKVIN